MSILPNRHPLLEEGFVNGNEAAIKLLNNPLITKDIWRTIEDLGLTVNQHQKALSISFESIPQDWLKLLAKLCNSNIARGIREYKPAPRVMQSSTFNKSLNRLAKKQNICTNNGKVWHFRSHQFRKTLATVMTNAGVRDLIIQKYLRHRSPDMQEHYKRLLKEVLGEEYHELMKGSSYVDSTGKMVAKHQPQNPITEFVRRKMYQITTQYGECHRPILKSPCQTVNACWQCEHWLTLIEDLPALQNDLNRVKKELEIASQLGMIRQQQGLTIDQQRLVIRIEGLEKIDARD